MTLYEYLKATYRKNGEPIFLTDVEKQFGENTRQYMQYLIKKEKVCRFKPGVYYLPYTDVLGLEGRFDTMEYIKQKYLTDGTDIYGYETGYAVANEFGITTQNPAVIEICTNAATTKQRRLDIGKRLVILYKPKTQITVKNYKILQFLDFLLTAEKYSELGQNPLKGQIRRIITKNDIDMQSLGQYLDCYPSAIYKILYKYGVL